MREQHFLQSTAWEQVRKELGHIPVRVGDNLLLIKQTPKPFKPFGYMPQVDLRKLNWEELYAVALQYDLSHIQLDPDNQLGEYSIPADILNQLSISPTESIYYRDTLVIDLTKSEDELQAEMHKKHRYNIRVSEKHDVKITVTNKDSDFETFLKLFFETVERQNYFGRTKEYYESIWKILKPLGKVQIATAWYKDHALTSWMLFLGDKTIYYPYGGSSEEHRNVMAANGLVWGIIKWGKKFGYTKLDLWGIDPQDSSEGQKSHGFSSFKTKFGGEQIHYLPSYDLIIQPFYHSLFKVGNAIRWMLLKAKRLISKSLAKK